MIAPTSVERKSIIQPLNQRPGIQPRLEVKSRDVSRQNKHYSPQLTPQVYHSSWPQNYPKNTVFRIHAYSDSSGWSKLPWEHGVKFSKRSNLEKDIQTKSPYQEEVIEQKYNSPTEKHRILTRIKKQINTS